MSIEVPNQRTHPEDSPPAAPPADPPPTSLIKGPLVDIKRSGAAPIDAGTAALFQALRNDFSPVVKAEVEWLDALLPFITEQGEPFVVAATPGGFDFAPLGSSDSRRLIGSYIVWRFDTPALKIVADFELLLKTLVDYAPTVELHNRFDRDKDDLLVDQGNGRQVRITADGIRSEPYDRPRFRRHPAHLPFGDPEDAEPTLELFEEGLGLSGDDLLLTVAACSAACVPETSKPILCVTGSPGAGKTTLSNRLVRLVDPSQTPTLGEPRNLRDLSQILAGRAVVSFDNLRNLSTSATDEYCRAVTGAQVETRKLFTDRGVVLFQIKCWTILNAIDPPSTRPDWLDRAIVLDLRRRPDFGSEVELRSRYERLLPRLRGALYRLTGAALSILGQVSQMGGERLADFANHGRAAARVLGLPETEFTDAYRRNRDRARQTQVEAEPWLELIVEQAQGFVGEDGAEEYQPADLLTALSRRATNRPRHVRKSLPKSPSWLTRKLRMHEAVLRDRGVRFETLHPDADRRVIRLYCVPNET